ncbi:MAG: hypothetical protein P8J87_09730 [Verrucomicrobiales bacterium]|nr:hypothetical protein [Verrucomicrobiales bacterium]
MKPMARPARQRVAMRMEVDTGTLNRRATRLTSRRGEAFVIYLRQPVRNGLLTIA